MLCRCEVLSTGHRVLKLICLMMFLSPYQKKGMDIWTVSLYGLVEVPHEASMLRLDIPEPVLIK
jgi:hypothetical protein